MADPSKLEERRSVLRWIPPNNFRYLLSRLDIGLHETP